MNKLELKTERETTWKSYHVPSMPNYTKLKKNAVFLAANNTYKHEISKALGALMLIKHGDIKFTNELISSINHLDKCAKAAMEGFPKQKAEFITEAVPNAEPNRRVDLVKLDDDTRIEFETNPKVEKDNCITVRI